MSNINNLCGWIPPDKRTKEQADAHEKAVLDMPAFNIIGRPDTVDKMLLTDLWKHPMVNKALGFDYPGAHQLTGSCVGFGGGNTMSSMIFVAALMANKREEIFMPFWLLNYGMSRYYNGDRSEGEGSTGSAFAKSAKEDGIIKATESGLPSFTHTDGIVYGSSVEYRWSNGANIDQKWLEMSRKHLVKTTAPCNSADDVRAAITNGYPCSAASDWGGDMQCQVKEGVLLNRHSGSWNHQMSYHGYWNHPKLGEIFYEMNNWGLDAHGTDPAGGARGGFWVKKSDVDYTCRNGEVYAFSQFEGFPAQTLPKELFKIV